MNKKEHLEISSTMNEIAFLAHRAKAIDVDRRELLQLLKHISKLTEKYRL